MQIHFILDRPRQPENIGAAARALKTMGFASLHLVDTEAHLEPAATWLAHGAGEILQGAHCHATLEQALAGMDLVIASTARRRGAQRAYHSPAEIRSVLAPRQTEALQVALLFGGEESGLSNAALARADLWSSIPLAVTHPSLNLAQAVMLYAYELSPFNPLHQVAAPRKADASGELAALRERIAALLARIDAADDAKLSEWLQDRLGLLDRRDVRMAHTLLSDILRALDP